MDEQRENMQKGMIENETTGEQKPDGGKERRRRGMGTGILLGICGTLVVGALGIYLTCRFTGSQILITNAAADTDGTTLLDAKTTAKTGTYFVWRRENAQNSSVMKGRFSLGMETVVVTAST